MPQSAEDIGVWQTMLDFLGIFSVIINFGIIFFASSYMEDTSWKMRWVTFICVEHIAVALKFFIGIYIEDIPLDVEIQMQR
jgi:hypothetical protein